jgi:hypothetical protein
MSTRIYWLEYADAPEHERQGPLGPSAVRHENGDCVRARIPDGPRWFGRDEWRRYWERATGRPLKEWDLAQRAWEQRP